MITQIEVELYVGIKPYYNQSNSYLPYRTLQLNRDESKNAVAIKIMVSIYYIFFGKGKCVSKSTFLFTHVFSQIYFGIPVKAFPSSRLSVHHFYLLKMRQECHR